MSHKKQPLNLTRREALKVLAALTGSTTLAHLPTAWETPVIEVGVLPLHAQTSQTSQTLPTISNLNESFTGLNDCVLSGGKSGSRSVVSFTYHDPLGQIGAGTTLHETATFQPSGIITTATVTNLSISGDGYNGTISRTACTRFEGNTSLILHVLITTADGRTSEPLTTTITAPPGAQEQAGGGLRG